MGGIGDDRKGLTDEEMEQKRKVFFVGSAKVKSSVSSSGKVKRR
jgi:hypothetical protein